MFDNINNYHDAVHKAVEDDIRQLEIALGSQKFRGQEDLAYGKIEGLRAALIIMKDIKNGRAKTEGVDD